MGVLLLAFDLIAVVTSAVLHLLQPGVRQGGGAGVGGSGGGAPGHNDAMRRMGGPHGSGVSKPGRSTFNQVRCRCLLVRLIDVCYAMCCGELDVHSASQLSWNSKESSSWSLVSRL